MRKRMSLAAMASDDTAATAAAGDIAAPARPAARYAGTQWASPASVGL